jgi:transcriptional regulator with XRE-family HTH domain
VDETESFGKYLKRERESKRISLREVAKNTRVREHLLKAIEEDRYEALPPSTYIKGFLLAYAKYIGLDPNDVLLRYESTLRGGSVSRTEVPPEKEGLWSVKHFGMLGGILLVGLIVTYFLFLRPSKPPVEPISEQPKVEKILPPPAPPQIAGTPSAPEEQPFSIQLKAVEETWLRIQVNGQPEHEMTLKPGETTFHLALKRVQLVVGNAGGLDIVFRGKSLERFGKPGEVLTLIFTPEGVEVKRPEKPKPP